MFRNPTTDAHSAADLVDGPLIRQSAYSDPAVFRLELERLFSTAWIYLGHECQLPSSGSYFLGHMGLTSVIVTRDRDDAIHVLENRCAHRGPAICAEPHGRKSVLTCPYHGWAYRLNGDLRSIPLADDYTQEFPKGERGLRRAARVDSYRGFIFASFAATGPDLETFLGPARIALDDFMDRAPEGEIVLADEEPLRHRYRGNWKIQFENLNDFLHPTFAHASATAAAVAGQVTASEEDNGAVNVLRGLEEITKGLQGLESVVTEYGHSYIPGFGNLSGVGAHADGLLKSVLTDKHGAEEAERVIGTDVWIALIYPSLIIKPGTQNIRIIRPLAHDETEVTMQIFRMPGAPDEVFQEAYNYFRLLGSPASPILADDLQIYELVQNDYGRDYLMSAERGFPQSETDPRPQGTSEAYIRRQYQVWRRYMEGQIQ
ncbi:MAG: aromatic ring-hydroxylating dioxygenase subunit alpha [Pseudomonadota bacterium]